MDNRTQKLTYGALLVAVFGVLLVVNRQTGGLIEDVIFFVLPIPMAIFCLKYGWKDGLPVFVCMTALSFFLGTLYTIFYAICSAILGMVLGSRLKSRKNLNQTQLIMMILSAVFSVLSSVVLASLFGIDLNTEILEMQKSMNTVLESAGLSAAGMGELLSLSSLKRLFIFTMVLMGVLQGFVTFRLSLIILKRLRLPVPDPQPIGLYFPPRGTGYLALLGIALYFMTATRPFENDFLQNLSQTIGLVSYMFLLCFGWIAVTWLIKKLVPGNAMRWLSGIIAMLLVFILPYAILALGFMYVSTGLHEKLMYG